MAYYGRNRNSPRAHLPSPEIDTLALSLSRGEEQAFIHGCNALVKGMEERARMEFRKAVKIDSEFMDAWFMIGFIELLNGRAEGGRQAYLRILRNERPFWGTYILRFLPTLRAHANLFEDFVFHIMPSTPDIAASTARIYLVENRNREAKKIIHPAFREYPENPAVQAVWAQSMLMDNAPDKVIEEIDRKTSYHRGKNDLDVLITYLVGRAYMDQDDFRSAISHWESLLHHATGKNPRLIDRFRICIAQAYEAKGFLIDVTDVLGAVEDSTMPYGPGISVEFKLGQLAEKMNTYHRQGIKVPLQYHELHEYPRWQPSPGFLEFKGGTAS